MRAKIILISKDVLRADYLEPYGNKYWKTGNVSALAAKGTVFRRHYTPAPSSAMAYTCMFSGLNAYQLNRSRYTEVKPFNQVPTLFDVLQGNGYKCHVIWDERWYRNAYRFSRSYGTKSTVFHNLKIEQTVGPHKIDRTKIQKGDDSRSLDKVIREIDGITDEKLFLWIHLPHVLFGRTGYGSDIDLLDRFVGEIRRRFADDSIYITADHGHMNCQKGIPVYGAHVYEGSIRIPLITPRIKGLKTIGYPTSNIQLKDIILEDRVCKLEFVFSDSQYYAQPNRKLAIINDRYKYIYNKIDNSEELYDLEWDESEDVNLLKKKIKDCDRNKNYFLNEVYFYPYFEEAEYSCDRLRRRKDEIWKKGPIWEETLRKVKIEVAKFIP